MKTRSRPSSDTGAVAGAGAGVATVAAAGGALVAGAAGVAGASRFPQAAANNAAHAHANAAARNESSDEIMFMCAPRCARSALLRWPAAQPATQHAAREPAHDRYDPEEPQLHQRGAAGEQCDAGGARGI